ncbi:VanZ family protein [Tabrizicola soli]|uniref:VanZ family protein n=1 Tax=Tabrizicola soli TaxID=2185115 RepID=A0ABV7DZP7_9RHOB|nr:VanZ family protein [Tabrizicola soli]
MGSDATPIVAEMAGQVGFGIELNPAHVEVAVQWWQDITGETAILESGGQRFDALNPAKPCRLVPQCKPDQATRLTLPRNVSLMARYPKERCVAQGQKNLKQVAVGSAVTLALGMIIAVLTLAPMPAVSPVGSDKVYHILAFAGLAFPLPLVRPRLTIWVVLGVIAYGGAIEMVQPFFGRQAEWADLLADGIGAVVGAVAGYALSRQMVPLPRYRDT